MTGKLLLDTNIVIDFLRGDKTTMKFFNELDEIWIAVITIGELLFGADNASKPELHRKQTEDFLTVCKVVDIDKTTATYYGMIRTELRKKGKPIPENDIWVSAVALQHNLTVVSNDKHFEQVKDLKIQKV